MEGWPASPASEAHVEGAAYEGQLVSFSVVALPEPPGAERIREAGLVLVFLVVLPLWAAVMAWRNAARGKADWNGALRLGIFCFGVTAAMGLLVSHHIAAVEGLVLWKVIREASAAVLTLSVLYLAFEPYVRRRMPRSLVSWNRLLEGRWRDALAGADILAGLAAYAAVSATDVSMAMAGQLGADRPGLAVSVSQWSAWALLNLLIAVGVGLSYLLVFAVLRFLLRRTWLAAVTLAVILSLAAPIGHRYAAMYCALAFLLARFGLVAAMALLCATRLMASMPLTTDWSRWYAWQGICAVLVLLTLGAYAFWTNLGGRPLWREED